MGLSFPTDLDAWQRWQRSRHRARALRSMLRARPAADLVLLTTGPQPAVLFAVEATTPTAVASVAEPIAHLADLPVAVVAPADISTLLPGDWTLHRPGAGRPESLRGLQAVVATGHYLPAGAASYAWARQVGAEFIVVQHGLLTPFAPPLPPGARLLAFQEDDGRFWASGRTDVRVDVVGSQLLWEAARQRADVDATMSPVFLGQLHGAELPRRLSAATATAFCRETGARYRPHPAETDRLSRWQHARWRRSGVRFAPDGPLLRGGSPVVSIFSTGVLEAAAAGLPAWVTCTTPPRWVGELWERYGLSPWGGPPTAAPPAPHVEPALAVAQRARATAEAAR